MGTPIQHVLAIKAMTFLRFLLVTVLFAFLGEVSADGDPLWGRPCGLSDQCLKPWSHCARSVKGIVDTRFVGECRLNIWVWVIIGLIIFLILAATCCCICMPCCILYNSCKCLRDVICFWKKE